MYVYIYIYTYSYVYIYVCVYVYVHVICIYNDLTLLFDGFPSWDGCPDPQTTFGISWPLHIPNQPVFWWWGYQVFVVEKTTKKTISSDVGQNSVLLLIQGPIFVGQLYPQRSPTWTAGKQDNILKMGSISERLSAHRLSIWPTAELRCGSVFSSQRIIENPSSLCSQPEPADTCHPGLPRTGGFCGTMHHWSILFHEARNVHRFWMVPCLWPRERSCRPRGLSVCLAFDPQSDGYSTTLFFL